ncbi:MAG: cation:proton antiporter [Thermoproteus sp.]|jgi:Kef-type K+ transport system membrane component KefB
MQIAEVGAVYASLLYLSLLLFLAAVLRYFLRRAGIPGLVAGLAAGMALAPTSLGGVLNGLFGASIFQLNDYIRFLADFAVILIIFAAGLEEGLAPLRSAGPLGVAGAALGALSPFAAGYAMLSPSLGRDAALYIGASLGATSLAAASAILLEQGVKGKGARFLTAAAAMDDVVTFIILTAVNILIAAGRLSAAEIAYTIAVYSGAWVFILFVSLAAVKLLGRGIREEYSYEFSLVVIFGLTAAMVVLGFSPIIAAFIAGVAVAEGLSKENIKRLTDALLEVFGPVFFAVVGAESDLSGIGLSGLVMGLALTAIAVLFKMIGIFPFAYLYTRDVKASAAISLGMVPRGETGLAIASLGLEAGVLTSWEFTALVLMGLLTTVIGAIAFSRAQSWLRGR